MIQKVLVILVIFLEELVGDGTYRLLTIQNLLDKSNGFRIDLELMEDAGRLSF